MFATDNATGNARQAFSSRSSRTNRGNAAKLKALSAFTRFQKAVRRTAIKLLVALPQKWLNCPSHECSNHREKKKKDRAAVKRKPNRPGRNFLAKERGMRGDPHMIAK